MTSSSSNPRSSWFWLGLIVNLEAMGNSDDADDSDGAVDDVHNSPIAYTNPSKVLIAFQLLQPLGLGLSFKDSILRTTREST